MNLILKSKNPALLVKYIILLILFFNLIACATVRYSANVETIPEYENKKSLLKEKSKYNPDAEEELVKNYKKEKKQIQKKADHVSRQQEKKIGIFLENPPADVTEYRIYDEKSEIVISRTFTSKDKSFEYMGMVKPLAQNAFKQVFFLTKYNEPWRNYFCRINIPLGIIGAFNFWIPTTWPCYFNMWTNETIEDDKKHSIQAGQRAAVVMGGNAIIVYPLHKMNVQNGRVNTNWYGSSIYIIKYHGKGAGKGKVIKIPKKIDDDSGVRGGSSSGALQAY
ncbi:MAG: hypothetical protein OEZ34_06950 [Spirochaetia bacterium]|nr:hypothetical protein [Spirochaetia bacterium]